MNGDAPLAFDLLPRANAVRARPEMS